MTLLRRAGTMNRHLLVAILILAVSTAQAWGSPDVPPVPGRDDSAAQGNGTSYHVNNVKWEMERETSVVHILGDAQPTYVTYMLFDPLRIVVDIAGAVIDQGAGLPIDTGEGPVLRVTGRILEDKKPAIARIEILLTEDRRHSVQAYDNNIKVIVGGNTGEMGEPIRGEKTKLASPSEAGTSLASLPPATTLLGLDVGKNKDETTVLIKADGPIIEYSEEYLQGKGDTPDRFYVDIPGIVSSNIPSEKEVGTSIAKVRTSQKDGSIRIVFDATGQEPLKFRLTPQQDGLLLSVLDAPKSDAAIAGVLARDQEQGYGYEPEQRDPANKPASSAKAPKSSKSIDFKGYTEKRISVDFFKIDLHNVFRLIGEVSGRNIVVDEQVSGSLTLALNDVPWDFVLEIILNLKDLQKEERFNTIVIAPRSKVYTWPQKETDIALEAIRDPFEGLTMDMDAIKVSKRIVEPPTNVMRAKEYIDNATKAEEAGEYESAVTNYAEAYRLMPENSSLASRLAALHLARLGHNADGVHYARMALAANPKDYDAALMAAIGLANMNKNVEAEEYFDLALGAPKPSSEALISYASYSEEKGNMETALMLLARHEDLYGDTLDTMVGKARIYDKIGDMSKASEEYKAALLSGFEIPDDLRRYIQGRLAMTE